jgi:hypothetical protein
VTAGYTELPNCSLLLPLNKRTPRNFLIISFPIAAIANNLIYPNSACILVNIVAMICAVCYGVLRGHQGSQWRGTFDLHFDHQRNRTELKNSAAIRCCICRSILSELRLIEQKDRHTFLRFWKGLYPSVGKLIWGEPFRLNQSDLTGQSNFIGAYLSEVPELEVPQPVNLSEVPDIELPQQLNLHEVPETELPQQPTLPKVPHLELSQQPKIYRLDFKLKDSERLGTFVLEQVGKLSILMLSESIVY